MSTELHIPAEAALPKTIECFQCGYRARVLKDATLAKHGTQRGGQLVWECPKSGALAPLHAGTFRIVKRNPNVWLAECACGETWTGSEYEDVETPWGAHHRAEMDRLRARKAAVDASAKAVER